MYYNKQSTRIYKKIVRISQNNLLEFFAYVGLYEWINKGKPGDIPDWKRYLLANFLIM